MKPRLLLLVPTTTYRAEAFVAAAKKLPVDISIASEEPSTFTEIHPVDLPAFAFDDPYGTADFIRDFARDNPIDAVVPVDDQATMAAAVIGETLGLAHNPPEAVHAAANKYRMRERLSERGVSQPLYWRVPADASPEKCKPPFDYPVVVKPLGMAASRGVIRANDRAEFADAFGRVAALVKDNASGADEEADRHLLVEQFVPGWEVALEGILNDGWLHVFCIFDKPDPLMGPYFPETIYTTPTRLPVNIQDAIVADTQAAVRALGLTHGPVHAELRGSGSRLWFIEIAARSIGGLCSRVVRFENGQTLEDVILAHALGRTGAAGSVGDAGRADAADGGDAAGAAGGDAAGGVPDLSAPPGIPARERQAAGVMMLQAPVSGRFIEARGLEAAKAVTNIDEIIIAVHPGQRLEPLPEGFLYTGFLFARADTPAEVESALREATETLEIVIEPE